ncbi:MAG: hypothetical protein ACOY0R_20440, partial [Chloroflexota bacterium]
HLSGNASWADMQISARGWAYWLGAAGLAFSAREQDVVNALAGKSAWGFDDDQIRGLLAKGLLLDGVAAQILTERGFGEHIGVQSANNVTQNDLLYSIEACSATHRPRGGFMSPSTASRSATLMSHYPQISVNNKPHTRQMLQAQLLSGAQIVSHLLDPLQNVMGHGAFTFENGLGGRISVVPWDASVSETPMMDIHRADQLNRIVRWLARDLETGSVEGGAWLIPQFLVSPLPLGEGLGVRAWRGVVWNASPDELDTFVIHCPAGMPAINEAWHLLPSGERLPAEVRGDQIILTHPMHQWEFVVIGNW